MTIRSSIFALLFGLGSQLSFGQASVAYYPFNSLISVSTNADRAFWLDARVQTNTFFGSLSTTLAPMINVARREQVNYYTGLSVRFNALNGIDNRDVLEGYALHVGVRVKPILSVPNLRVAFEIAPYAQKNFKVGVLQSFLGVAYQFKKRE
ncbi:hypothetical protein BN8_00437 [Fibrisoma limi BUZ 3]|uniref:Outer membrane protein beta-barrel domain-containing protein n=1 Tax=Fibrisoma limi BUZ 3 TaxID=1185876 RepID=I2GC85_9BACT|nr:hypothetical protein [Fibrisoma limi]CCH51509.1 hypothetical protein BN8_00437 [Fibrisoma limi BUZ 3]